MGAEKTLWGLIAEWIGIDKRYNDADQLRTCADSLTPIAEELERAVKEWREHDKDRDPDIAIIETQCAERISRILGEHK